MMKVSAIVVNYNGGTLVRECLSSILNQKASFNYEVIVVDNCSSDGSREDILTMFPEVRLIANESNLGFSRANNQAIRSVASQYILLLNIDAYLREKYFLEKACEFMDHRGDCGGIGPEIISPSGKVQNPYYKSYPNIATEFLSLSGLLGLYNILDRGRYFYTKEGLAYYVKSQKPIAVAHLCGACMFLRKESIQDIGLFDEDMFFYREDMDLSFRLKKKGWKIFILPYLTAIHVGRGSWGNYVPSIEEEVIRSKYIFFKKHYSRNYPYIRLIHFIIACFRILIYPLLRIWGRSTPRAFSFYKNILKSSLIGV